MAVPVLYPILKAEGLFIMVTWFVFMATT